MRRRRIAAAFLLLASLSLMLFAQTAIAATPAVARLEVGQVFDKPAASDPADIFDYILTAQSPTNPMPLGSVADEYEFTITGDDVIDIDITFDAAGTYSYEIKQVIDDPQAGYTYDEQVFTVTVYVTESTPGELSAQVVIKTKDGEKADEIEFENGFTPSPTIMVDPPVKKTVQGTPPVHSVFTFKLEAADPANPMPVGSENGVKYLYIQGSGEDDFGTWEYTDPGVYYYTVSEVNTGINGYIYDTAIYTITDDVRLVSGQLELTRTVTNASGKQVEAYIFINTYKAPAVKPTNPPKVTDTAHDFYEIDQKVIVTKPGEVVVQPIPPTVPKTGDESNAELYRGLLAAGALAAAGCAFYLWISKKRGQEAQS